MRISADSVASPLIAGYSQTVGVYDEMADANGALRPHWDRFIGSLTTLGKEELTHRWRTARQRIRENGVTYNVYGDPLGADRPWSLDAIPLVIPAAEWSKLEEGLIQRARLLNQILADLYGPQELLRGGHIPPALVFGNPAFWRPCHNLPVAGNTYLHLLAVDLARSPDGDWWVLSDRTQAPSGAGYAFENRNVMSETLPDLFREFRVRPLPSFFRSFRETLLRLSPAPRVHPRMVLLTPGPYNETYFEHSYLARYLGLLLVQGGDLTVRDSRVYLKTLEGLKPVDVILRRVDDSFCDPIELRSDSYLGVAGLVEAVRAGNVAVANALGSGLIETSAFMPFLPGLSRRMLGEELKLPAVATWWCGQPDAFRYVRENLDRLVLKPAFPSKGMEPVFGGKLAGAERSQLLERFEARPHEFVGQELLHLSTVPVWSDQVLAPRRVVLRVYLAAHGDSWVVMPGGLARVSSSISTPVVSMQRGGGSKDTWILSNGLLDTSSLQRPRDLPIAMNRGETSDLPSRAADHIFWLGRYTERCEHLARVLRCILIRLTGESGGSEQGEWESLQRLYDSEVTADPSHAESGAQGHLDESHEFEQAILAQIFDDHRSDSVNGILNRAGRMAAHVRDRLSSDLLRVVSQFGTLARAPGASAWGYVPAGDALAALNHCIAALAALRGIEMENMTRGPGWRFLNIGRRIERSIHLVKLFRAILVPLRLEASPALEMLLEVADSSMTYRARYFTSLQAAPALDLLMNDETNPRSLAFQMKDLSEHCRTLASMPSGAGWPATKQRRLEEAASNLFHADIAKLCVPDSNGVRVLLDELLSGMEGELPNFSDAITHAYFSHAEELEQGNLIYHVRHVTVYDYADPVSVSHHVLRLTPRNLPRQRCSTSLIAILPSPHSSTTRTDYFGNTLTFFTLREPHGKLTVEASSELEVLNFEVPDLSQSRPWERVPQALEGKPTEEILDAYQFVFDSERVAANPKLADYARDSFLAGRPLLEAARDLTRRIHQDFRFDTEATEVTTPVQTFFEKRRGVCQDFAHLQIACMRSLGLPARYVSGYLRTTPAAGRPRLEGADASHAWCSAWCPETGWVDFDPTNDCVPSDGHVTLAWGRDYSDVCPIHGVLLGGARHTLHVGVDVIPVE